MVQIDRFSVRALFAYRLFGDYRRRLVLDQKTLLQIVSGDEIADQYQVGDFFVVITNYDYFDYVSTWIHLLNGDGRILDIVSTPDYFGYIGNVEEISPGCLRFGFFGTNDVWTLHVSERGVWSFTFGQLARRLNRFVIAKRYLSLDCQKGKPWRDGE